ncbi:hypothetical protein FE257_011410 [Aspergillus nanangensis]|uniref:Xylanolytic transcriptional activator regulatory domain-containing protein n=1 Tax=Aspergillus nanangensis TaxID=2582783 RepID=A0AAD4CIR8_ASPNN|nr:hypothetical protein FE257_011410 [Aspergillus nanangensis]
MSDTCDDGHLIDRCIGSVITVLGRAVLMTELLSDILQMCYNERWLVFEGIWQNTGEKVILKARYELDPRNLRPDEVDGILPLARQNFITECEGSGRTPRLLGNGQMLQGPVDPYPRLGFIRVIIMTKAPGPSLVNRMARLDEEHISIIRDQLVHVLEYMRLRGWGFASPGREQIFWDAGHRTMHHQTDKFQNVAYTPPSFASNSFTNLQPRSTWTQPPQQVEENHGRASIATGTSDDMNTWKDIFESRHQKFGHGPVTPSTQQPSPVVGNGNDNNSRQLQCDLQMPPDDAVVHWDPSLRISNTSTAPASHHHLVPDYELEDNSLFSAQDLLVLQDLEMFSNNMGLNNNWYLPSEPSITQIFAGDSNANTIQMASIAHSTDAQSSSRDHSLSKLPTDREVVAEFGVLTLPILTITNQHRDRLLQALAKSYPTVADASLPSCHSLSRFVNGFFDGFYPHLPMVHIPTFRINECEPDILLAMCALGAEVRHEKRKAVQLFRAARDILQQTTSERELVGAAEKVNNSGNERHESTRQKVIMREARCIFLLIAFATWQDDESIAREAFKLQSSLARCVRESGLEEGEYSNNVDWSTWVQQESDRRVKLFSFAFLNIHSIAFGTPPVILTEEINLRLPCSCLDWIAPNQEKWQLVRRSGCQEQMLFQNALCHVMKSHQEPYVPSSHIPSPMANYILLHAIIQQIILIYHALGPYNDANHSLINGQKEIMRNALHAWTSLWQRAPESSLDPRNPNGPVTFTSTALLGVAYVRLSFNIGSYKILRSRDPQHIASHLLQIPRVPAGPHLLPAILHATHALSIPVKLGVNFVAQSHAFVWSVQHSLCGLEFAIFLSKWLFCISDSQARHSLDEHETRLVSWISDIVEEGRTSGDDDLWAKPSQPSDCAYLGVAVVKLWGRLIRGNEQWSLMRVIGGGLDIYAETCEQDIGHTQATT